MSNKNTGEIVLYQPDNFIRLDVRVDAEMVWLNRQQMAILFDRDVKTIGKHINNALIEELQDFSTVEKEKTVEIAENPVVSKLAITDQNPTVANFATVQIEGNREVLRNIEYYSLDVILSVGYRVKSQRGIQFSA